MPADHVLMFNSDSMICSRSHLSIDDFLKYDFIGAPLAAADENYGEIVGVSGGLSLRSRRSMVAVARKINWSRGGSSNRDENGDLRKSYEDEFFWDGLVEEPWGKSVTLPDLEAAVCRPFLCYCSWMRRLFWASIWLRLYLLIGFPDYVRGGRCLG